MAAGLRNDGCGTVRQGKEDNQVGEGAQVHGSVLKPLSLYLARNGLTLEDVSRRAGVTLPPAGATFTRFFSLNDFAHLLEQAAKLLNDECIGLSFGGLTDGGPVHPLMLAVGYAPTPRTALDVIAAHHRSLMDLAECNVRSGPRKTELVWRLSPRIVLQDHLVDRIAGALATRLTTTLGTEMMRQAEFQLARSRPADIRQHRQLFGPSIAFDAAENSFSLPVELAERALARHDPALFAALVELAQRRIADRRQAVGVAGLVCEEIALNLARTDLSLDAVARTLGMSPRVLQRRLADQDHTFQDLYDQVRRETAADLLRNTSLPISEIAFRLGFAAVGNFTRAAKRWFGAAPSQWRNNED